MRHALAVLGLLMIAAALPAQGILQEISWADLAQEGRLEGGELVTTGSSNGNVAEVLAVVNREPTPITVKVLTIDDPGVTLNTFMIQGQVSHQAVEGQGYVEMISVMPDGNRYFSRTLAPDGPARPLEGTSPWRDLVVPFSLGDSPQRPVQLELKVHLPGRGTVYLSPLRLIQTQIEQQ
jgi:hypothetical protein